MIVGVDYVIVVVMCEVNILELFGVVLFYFGLEFG